MTLDHSHVIFKIDNPEEQKVQDMDKDIAAGTLELDPFKPGARDGPLDRRRLRAPRACARRRPERADQ